MATKKKTAAPATSNPDQNPAAPPASGLKLHHEQAITPMDPALQSIVIKSREAKGKKDLSTVSTYESDSGHQMVDVIAELKDGKVPVPGFKVVTEIGGGIFTGAVKALEIETVRTHPNVLSLKAASRILPNLRFSVPDSQATPAQLRAALPEGAADIDGSGVIVGIVDYGCDFAHPNFLHSPQRSRLLALWDQNGAATSLSPNPYGYGREFTNETINRALATDAPYDHLRYRIGGEEHGTHVMDIAAGNGRGTRAPGMAPGADLIFVQLAVLNDVGGAGNFGNSRRLLEAVDYIFRKAEAADKPCVVNLSLGTHGGPHDGSTPVERGFDALLAKPGRAIVISAGNSYQRKIHSHGLIAKGSTRELRWVMSSGDSTPNELEIWYPGTGELHFSLRHPSGEIFGPVPLGGAASLRDAAGQIMVSLIHRKKDPGNGDNNIDILFNTSIAGEWTVLLEAVGKDVEYHAWVERDDQAPSSLHALDATPEYTLGSISCGRKTIAVAASTSLTPGHEIASFSSAGPTRDGRQKPEICAPGVNIKAAESLTQGSTDMSGTSMAAPHVTGLAALLFQAAGRPLTAEETLGFMTASAMKNAGQSEGWHQRFGAGRIHAAAAIRLAKGLSPLSLELSEPALTVTQGGGVRGRLSPAGSRNLPDWMSDLAHTASQAGVRVKLELTLEPCGAGGGRKEASGDL